MKVSRRELLLLTVLFAAICGFLYYNFYFAPVMQEIDALSAERESLGSVLSNIKLQQAAMEPLKKQAEELRAQAGRKLGGVMEAIDQPDMLVLISDQLAGLSDESTLSFTQDYEDLTDSRICRVTAQFLTNYGALREILSRLDRAPGVNRVIKGTLDETGGADDLYRLQANLTVEFFTGSADASGIDYPFLTGDYPNTVLFP